METSTKNLNFEFIDDPTLEDFTNGTVDFVFNGRTHKIYKQILSPEDDYCIHCIKDKTKVISTFYNFCVFLCFYKFLKFFLKFFLR